MPFDIEPVPFTVDNDIHFGLTELRGLLSADAEDLILEFRPVMLGMIKMAMKTVYVPLAQIRSMEFDSKFFGAYNRLTIRTATQAALDEIPGSEQGRLRLNIKRIDREAADELCDEIELFLAGMG